MIDYKKLQEAHNKVLKTNLWLGHEIGSPQGDKAWSHFSLILNGGEVIYEDSNLDFIIEKIEELSKPKPRYAVGDKLMWVDMENNKYSNNRFQILEGIVHSIDFDEDAIRYVFYLDDCWELKEEDLYPTRQALIEAQIEYWSSMSEAGSDTNGATKECEPNPSFGSFHPRSECKGGGSCSLCVDDKECEHESDGYSYITNHTPREHSKKMQEMRGVLQMSRWEPKYSEAAYRKWAKDLHECDSAKIIFDALKIAYNNGEYVGECSKKECQHEPSYESLSKALEIFENVSIPEDAKLVCLNHEPADDSAIHTYQGHTLWTCKHCGKFYR